MKKQLVIIGNGMAPGKMLDLLLAESPDEFHITIFNAEPRVNYNRIMLSPVLAGEKTYEEIITHPDEFYQKHNICLYKGQRVVRIDRNKQCIETSAGVVARYDILVIATGSRPFIVPVPGKDLPGVLSYRDLDDVQAMLKACETARNAVVIGGGLLGLEAAAGLQVRGLNTTVVHLNKRLMNRQLDSAAGSLLEQELVDRGIRVLTQSSTKTVLGDEKVTGVMLEDGTEIPADIVVMAVGIQPETALAESAGLETGRGILINDLMQTSDPKIYALGECVEHRGACYGLVAPLFEMAEVLAKHLSEADMKAAYTGSVTATRLKVTGIDLFSAGDFSDDAKGEELVLRDVPAGVYKRLVLREGKLVGAVLYGDTTDGQWYFDLLKEGVGVDKLRDVLIFGKSFQDDNSLDPTVAVAALPVDLSVNDCNGVLYPVKSHLALPATTPANCR